MNKKYLVADAHSPLDTLAPRLGRDGWEILCSPGPLAALLQHLAGHRAPLRTELIEGRVMAIIPLNARLDQAIEHLVDALITVRYDSNRVQLELFAADSI